MAINRTDDKTWGWGSIQCYGRSNLNVNPKKQQYTIIEKSEKKLVNLAAHHSLKSVLANRRWITVYTYSSVTQSRY